MARRKTMQTSFAAGELAPDFYAREDTEQYANGARSLSNRRVMIGGGTKRRPGTWREQDLAVLGRLEEFKVDELTKYLLLFSAGRVDAFLVDLDSGELTASGSVESTLWTGTIWSEMDYEQSGNTAFLTHIGMRTQKLLRTDVAVWAVSNFAFFTSGPRTEQPYYKTADPATSLQVSDVTGSITLTASAVHFESSHVGNIVRYSKREITITAVAVGGLTATGTVVETLPETYQLNLTANTSAVFQIDEVVEGGTSGARGVITSIPTASAIVVVLVDGVRRFAPSEDVVSKNGKSKCVSQVITTNAAIKDWDEAIFNTLYGWPGTCVLHRNRLLFGGHPAAPNALIGSKIGNLFSFDVGDASDGDAIFETIGDAGASEIVQLHSAEQLIVLTDHGPYYVPESTPNNTFRPSSIEFKPFGSPWPITRTARARAFDDGVLFVSGSSIIKGRPTGDLQKSWVADEVSLISAHLVSSPTRLAVVSNFDGRAERYAVAVNDDGTLAILQLVEAQKIRNMTPWSTEDGGIYTSVAAVDGYLYATTTRNGRYYLERFDQALTLDLVTEYDTQAQMDAAVPTAYGDATTNVVTADLNYHLGEYPPALTTLPAGPYHVGLFYDSVIETLPPVIDDEEGPHSGELMRILEAFVRVNESARFRANGRTLSAYQATDDLDEPPPRRDGPQRFEFLGWVVEPTITINQPDPLPLHVQGIKQTVAF